MPTMCGDGGGFGTATRSDLRRQDCTLWRVLLLLHVRLSAKKSRSGTAQVAWHEVCHQQGCPWQGWVAAQAMGPADDTE